jgi:hypothetical protein
MSNTFSYKSKVGFVDALRYGSLLVAARFTVYQGGKPVGTPYDAHLSYGAFTIDRNSEFRRTGEITIEVLPTIPPPVLMPVNPSSLLAPFGTEVFIETGVVASGNNIPSNSINWIPDGLFAIATSQVDDTGPNCTVTLQLYDRAWTLAQRVLKNPYNFPATGSGNFVSEIQALLNLVWNEQINVQPLQYNIVPTAAVVPTASYSQGSDPWQAALDMAASVGYELYFSETGIVVGHPIPDPNTTVSSMNFTDQPTYVQGYGGTGSTALLGSAYSTPVEVSVKMTRDGVHNDVIVQGTGSANAATYNGNGLQTSGQPILAEAADTNPLSPTFIGGAMGDVPNFVQSSLVTNVGAQGMANNDLQQALSSTWSITLAVAPNPTLDVNDIVTITRPRVGLTNARVVIDTITHTFNYADLMYITGRILSNNNPVSP